MRPANGSAASASPVSTATSAPPSTTIVRNTRDPLASVIIPAHDEEAVIRRCLEALLRDASPGEFDVIVACNGCSDATPEIARRIQGVRVVEIAEASKTRALDAAEDLVVATGRPRLYVDADVELDTRSARALARALAEGGFRAASARTVTDLTGCSLPVRLYHRFSRRLTVFERSCVGAGVYGLSTEGRARFDRWPAVVGDDIFVTRLFSVSEQTRVATAEVIVHPPRRFSDLVRRGIRVVTANRDVAGVDVALHPPPPSGLRALIRSTLGKPAEWPALTVFVTAQVLMRIGSGILGHRIGWMRDDESRVDDPRPSA